MDHECQTGCNQNEKNSEELGLPTQPLSAATQQPNELPFEETEKQMETNLKKLTVRFRHFTAGLGLSMAIVIVAGYLINPWLGILTAGVFSVIFFHANVRETDGARSHMKKGLAQLGLYKSNPALAAQFLRHQSSGGIELPLTKVDGPTSKTGSQCEAPHGQYL